MILGHPNLQSVLDLIEADGCPYCDEFPGTIFVGETDANDLEGN